MIIDNINEGSPCEGMKRDGSCVFRPGQKTVNVSEVQQIEDKQNNLYIF